MMLAVLGLVLLAGWVFGWRAFARATSPRAANALLGVLAVAALTLWVVSGMSFDAG